MNIYVVTDHAGRIAPGACAIAVANDPTEAMTLLKAEIEQHGGLASDLSLKRIDDTRAHAIVFRNGELG